MIGGLAHVLVVYDSSATCEDAEITAAKADVQRVISALDQQLELLNLVARSSRLERPTEFDRRRPSTETLEWIAYVYMRAVALRKPPKQAVAADLGVSAATAGRWIAAARAAGHLPATPPT